MLYLPALIGEAFVIACFAAAVAFFMRALLVGSKIKALRDNRTEQVAMMLAIVAMLIAQSGFFLLPIGHSFTTKTTVQVTVTAEGQNIDRAFSIYLLTYPQEAK